MAAADDSDADASAYASVPDELGTDHPTRAILFRRWERLNVRDEHWMSCVVGEEGSGKSYTALRMAKMIDPSFDESQAFFDPGELLRVLKDGEFERGDIYVVDEAGVGLGNRTWHDETQVQTNQALQLIRDHNIGVIFTLPRLGELDSQTKGRLQDVVEMVDKEDGEFVTCKWWGVDVDRLDFSTTRDGTWMEKPAWQGRKISALKFTPPEYEFIDAYEAKKNEFQEQVYGEAIGDEEDEGDDELSGEQLVLDLLRRAENDGVEDLLGWHGGRNKPVIKTQKIQYKYDVSRDVAQALKEALRDSPGISISDAWEDRAGTEHTQA